MELLEFMVDWTIKFVKNKDILTKKIESIETKKDSFDIVIKYKDKTQFFIIKPAIDDLGQILGKIKAEQNIGFSLVALNSKENLDIIIKDWDKLIKLNNFNIYFINPFSNLDKKWIICPYIHHKVCDESSLETGLKSIFETVEPITEEQLKKLI